MKRVLVLVSVLGLCVSVVGCGSDPREGLVAATVNDLGNAATKVANIKAKIEDAVKKTEAGKTPDFKEAILEVDALKKIAKEMQELKMKTESLKDKTTEEERKALADQYREQVANVVERLSKTRKELIEAIASVESQHKDAFKPVRDKLVEAEGEFEAISRQR